MFCLTKKRGRVILNEEFEYTINNFFKQNNIEIQNDPAKCIALLNDCFGGGYYFEIEILNQVIELEYHKIILKTETPDFTAHFLIAEMVEKKYLRGSYSRRSFYSIIALLFLVLRNYCIQKPNRPLPYNGNPPAGAPLEVGISPEKLKQVYTYSQLVHNGNLSIKDAVQVLVDDYYWKSGSARLYISNIKCFFEGRCFCLAMSREAIIYFLEQIQHDYGRDGLQRALNSIRLHLENPGFYRHAVGQWQIYNEWTRR
jgi:hypothetical protein